MTGPRAIHFFLVVFGFVVVASFSYGGYLMCTQRTTSGGPYAATAAEENVQRLLAAAESHVREKRVEQALVAYRKALALTPDAVEAQLGIASAELMAGRELVAAQEYERALRLDGNSRTAYRQLGRIYSHRRQTWDASIARFNDYLRLKPDDTLARLDLARVLAWNGNVAAAAEIFSMDAVARLMTAEDRKDYAFALVRLGRHAQAEALLHKLAAAQPRDSELKKQLAAIYASRQDWDSALPLYAVLLHDDPDDPHLNLTYGLGLLSTKRYRAALGPLERARNSMPSNGEAGLGYARALKGNGDLKKAASEFSRVLPQYRDSPGILREYADLLIEKRDYYEAEEFYKDAFRLGLRDTRLLVGLTGALRGRGKHREALPYLQEAYAMEPTERLAFELASVLQKVGRHKDALELLNGIEKSSRRSSKPLRAEIR